MSTDLVRDGVVDPQILAACGGVLAVRKTEKGETAPPAERPLFSRINFYGNKTKGDTLRALMAAGVEPDSFYLTDKAGLTKCHPFQCYVLMTSTFLTQKDGDGNTTDILHDVPGRFDETTHPDLWNDKYRREMIGLAAVRTAPGVLVPASFNFRNAMISGFRDALDVIALAGRNGGADWARRGALQKAAVDAGLWATFRVLVDVWGESGNFYQSHSRSQPTPAVDFDAIKKISSGDGYKATLNGPLARHLARTSAWIKFAEADEDVKTDPEAKIPY